jgi:hypothetical protein
MTTLHTGSTPGSLGDNQLWRIRRTLELVAGAQGTSVEDDDAREQITLALTTREVFEKNSVETLQTFILSCCELKSLPGAEEQIRPISKTLAIQLVLDLGKGRFAANVHTGQDVTPVTTRGISLTLDSQQGRQSAVNVTPSLCGRATQSSCKDTPTMTRQEKILAKLQEIGEAADIHGCLWEEERSTAIRTFNQKFQARCSHVCLARNDCIFHAVADY